MVPVFGVEGAVLACTVNNAIHDVTVTVSEVFVLHRLLGD